MGPMPDQVESTTMLHLPSMEIPKASNPVFDFVLLQPMARMARVMTQMAEGTSFFIAILTSRKGGSLHGGLFRAVEILFLYFMPKQIQRPMNFFKFLRSMSFEDLTD